VSSNPLSGAQVVIDGVSVGSTNVDGIIPTQTLIEYTNNGGLRSYESHHIQISKSSYSTYDDDIYIGSSQTINIQLSPSP